MAEFDLTTIKRKMLRKYPAFGSTISSVKYQIVGNNHLVKTAGTDGRTIYCNAEYLSKLTDDEQVFVFAHEVCHIALNHILRSEGRDPELWNIATDAVINEHLQKDGLPLVEGGVYIKGALKYDAEELYEKLLAEKQKQQKEQNQQGNSRGQQQNGQQQSGEQSQNDGQKQGQDSGSDEQDKQESKQDQQQRGQDQGPDQDSPEQSEQPVSGGAGGDDGEQENYDVGHDAHSLWEEAIKEAKEEQEKKQSKGKGKGQSEEETQDQSEQQAISEKEAKEEQEKKQSKVKGKGQSEEETQDQSEQQAISEKEAFEKNDEEKIRRAEEVMSKLSTDRRGLGGSSQEAYFDDIGKGTKAIVNWKKLLQSTLELEDEAWGHKFSDRTNGYAARIEDVEYDEQAETEIILDTSGSVSVKLLKSFLRQVKTILKNSVIRVGSFSNNFHGFVEIKKESDIDNLRIRVGGGTNFDAASRAFTKRKYVNKICFTDGQDGGDAKIRDKRKDIVWISFKNPNFKPDNGKVIFVPASHIQEFKVQEERTL